jgi:glucosamine-6-phosphate deaminase
MEIIIKDNFDFVVEEIAKEIENLIKEKPNAVLGLPTGNTPLKMYSKLIEKGKKGEIDFSNVRTFNLDEYAEIKADDPSSFRYYMFQNFFNHINIKKENIHFPPSELKNIYENCKKYDKTIENLGGIDLMILGIGRNGHIGFNEPTSSLDSRTRVKTLTEETLKINNIKFEGVKYPDLAVTMGIKTILSSKRIILIAEGEGKAEAIKKTVEEPVGAMWPSSVLQMHEKVKIIIDEKAASKLKLKDYYKRIYSRKVYVDALLKEKN